MNQENLEILMDRWINDPQFKEQLKDNPQSAIENAGVSLSKEDLEALRNIDWTLSDEQLQTRISKGT